MSVAITGLDSTLSAFDKFGAVGRREAEKAVAATAIGVRGDAVKSIERGTKSGVTYKRAGGSNLSPTHTASASGEAPATDTGNLVSSLQFKVNGLSATVFSREPYAFWLEYGTLKIAPRPFLIPAADGRIKYFADKVEKGLTKAAEAFNK